MVPIREYTLPVRGQQIKVDQLFEALPEFHKQKSRSEMNCGPSANDTKCFSF